jgi:hypothetical protein
MSRRLVASILLLAVVTLGTVAEGETVSASIRRNPKLVAGADADGRVLLYTPRPIKPGSTHSHFDLSASPNLLMEPSINSDLKIFKVDLTKWAMKDLGWNLGSFNAEVNYSDSPGQGFNDPTLGDMRKTALEAAVAAWGRILGSAVTVTVEARFAEQRCEDTGATLASAGPTFVFMDFEGGVPGVWFPGSLAESMAGINLSAEGGADPGAADLRITFNSGIDESCIREGSRFYYGLDTSVPAGEISFVTVAMHELGHGLGFLGLVDESTGELFQGFTDAYTSLTYDTKKQKHWDEMTNAQRKKSAKRERKVSFDGKKTTRKAKKFLNGRVVIEIEVPDSLAGNYDVGEAGFGPRLNKKGVRGDLAIVDDGSANPTLGCESLVNGAELAGKVAVIDRGDCLFVDKVKNAQDAGAVAVIIVNNVSGLPPGLGGNDQSIDIPAVSITRADGKKIKRVLRR